MEKPLWSDVHVQVHRGLRMRSLLPPGAAVVVAVSGGQDSITLLRLLLDLQPKWHWRLQVVHGDHRWRPDSADNAAFVQDLCQGWGIPCRVVTAGDIPATEAAARQWRYQVFETIAQEGGYTHVATGHTATDRAETLLYNLIRGSGADGLQALAWQRPLGEDLPQMTVVRPLLDLTRQDTADFCQRFALPIWPDPTNQEVTYARNRLRLAVMPYLREHFNPRVETALAHTAELLMADVACLDALAQALYATAVQFPTEHASWQLHRPSLRTAPLALQRRVVRQVLGQVMTAEVGFSHIEKLVALIDAPNRTQTDPFPGGLVAVVAADWILLQPLAADLGHGAAVGPGSP
ncbi:MAG: tRNA lysidine(34) synthetase TilS [Nodosilinea sp.]